MRISRLIDLCIPPIFFRLKGALVRHSLPALPAEFRALERGQYAAYKLLNDFRFNTILDVGAGACAHSQLFHNFGKNVTALDLGESVYAERRVADGFETITSNFFDSNFEGRTFDCVWASHVLEHQNNVCDFLGRCLDLVSEGGILAIVVPPMKDEIEGGHLSVWNAGLVLYNLAFMGVDCRNASVLSEGYNVSIILPVKRRPAVNLTWDSGDIDKLKPWMPSFVEEPFDGRILKWNW